MRDMREVYDRQMKVKIKKTEILRDFRDRKFVYFDFFGNEKKTIVTPKSLKYLKIDDIREGDEVDIQKGIRNGKETYLITEVVK